MALDDLQGIIEKLQQIINVHRDYLSKHETRTRQVLIDPLLRELGWDVSDPEAVQLEYRVGQQWADYALMSDGQPVAVIEAKRLGRSLEDDEIMQVLNYANRDGIDYMIVTDGDHWEMYEVFKRGTLEERMLMKFQLSQQLPHKNALQALEMWKPNLVSDSSPSEVTESTVLSHQSLRQINPAVKPTEKQPQQLPMKIHQKTEWYLLHRNEDIHQFTNQSELKIGDDMERSGYVLEDVVQEVIIWLIDTGKLGDNDFPIELGRVDLHYFVKR